MKIIVVILFMYAFSLYLGKSVVKNLKLKNTKHPVIYGILGYMSIFMLACIPLVFLGVSWNVFFWTQIILTVCMGGFAGTEIYLDVRDQFVKEKPTISWGEIWGHIKDNYGVYTIIIISLFLYLSSLGGQFLDFDNLRFNFANSDDHVYIAHATKVIDSTNIGALTRDYVYGGTMEKNWMFLVSYWELFWSYGSTFFKMDMLSFIHTVIPFFTYSFLFLTIDEILNLYPKNRKRYYQLIYIIFLLPYITNYTYSEYNKLMFMPWYGNVFSTFCFIPWLFLLYKHSLYNKKALLYTIIFPLIATGFSIGSIVFVAILYLPFLLLWNKYERTTKSKKEKILYISIFSLGIFIFFVAAVAVGAVSNQMPVTAVFTHPAHFYSEQVEYKNTLFVRLPIVIAGTLLFLMRKNKMKKSERFIVSFLLVLLMCSAFYRMSSILFNLFSFSYRRFTEAILWYFIVYCFYLFLSTFKKEPKKLLAFFAVYIVLSIPIETIFLLQKRSFFSISQIFNPQKTSNASKDISTFFSDFEEETMVCVLNGRQAKINDTAVVDLSVALVSEKNIYISNCTINDADENDYVIFSSIEPEADKKKIVDNYKYVETVSDENITLEIYENTD